MYRYIKTLAQGAAILFVLSVVAAAGSKVAIIKVNSGTAKLDGKTIAKAQMASEGQRLEVAEGSTVRVQLLGSKGELTVTGPSEIIVSKSALQGKATEVGRKNTEVASDIGNRNTASASISRGSGKPKLVELRPTIPPKLEEGEFLIEFEPGDYPLQKDHTVKVEVVPLDGDGPRASHIFKDGDPLVALQMPPDLEQGKGYRFSLIYNAPGQNLYTYRQTFRILTDDQKALLKEAEQELLDDYRAEKDILPLLRLASLYQEFDQNQKVLQYLQMAYNSEYLKDEEQWSSLRDTIDMWEQSIRMPVPEPAK